MAGISKKRIKTKKGEVIKYTITYTDIFGKQHTKGIYDTLKEAKRDLWKFEEVKEEKTITYGFIFQNFLNKVKIKNAEGTYINYNMYYKKHFRQFDNIEYEKINSLYWQEFFDNLEKDKGAHLAAHCLKMAKAAVNRLIKHNIIDKNVFNKVEKIKIPKADIQHLTIEEIKQVLNECKKSYPQYYVLLYTFIGTGAREGEIFALEKKDFIYTERKINIHKQFTRGKLKLKPKTENSNRTIYIFDDLAQVLKNHIAKSNPKNPLLFPNQKGGYIDGANLRERFWKPLLKLCGIDKRVRLHDLRGSYIDMILSSGLSVKFAQNQVGHARAETTTNIYARNNTDMIQSATKQLNNVFIKTEQNLSKIKKPKNSNVILLSERRAAKGI